MIKDPTKRIKISTTISVDDKDYLDKTGINASTALSMGVKLIKNTLNTSSSDRSIVANKAFSETPKDHASLSDSEIDAFVQQRLATLQRLKNSTPWKTTAEVAAYFSKKKSSLHGLEEVHEEDDQDIP